MNCCSLPVSYSAAAWESLFGSKFLYNTGSKASVCYRGRLVQSNKPCTTVVVPCSNHNETDKQDC